MQFSIRRVEPCDYDQLREIYQGSSVINNTLQLPMPSLELWKKRLIDTSTSTHQLVATDKDIVVGYIILNSIEKARRNHVAHIAMAVKETHQNMKVGTALLEKIIDLSDNWLGLLRLELTVFTDNKPALALYKKMGFVIEGTNVAATLRNGKYADEFMMARLHPKHPSGLITPI